MPSIVNSVAEPEPPAAATFRVEPEPTFKNYNSHLQEQQPADAERQPGLPHRVHRLPRVCRRRPPRQDSFFNIKYN